MTQVVIALGSNLADRFAALQGAVDTLRDTPGVEVTAVSAIYETVPVDAPDDSGDYLNAVVLVETELSARTVLERCQAVESAYGRVRTGVVNESRTLDLDVIAYGETKIDEPDLIVPHPRAHERAFVMVPWADVDPSVHVDLARLDLAGVVRRDDLVIV